MDAPRTPPLAQLLEHGADALRAVRAGRSLNDVLAEVPLPLRPGVQALTFHALRQLGAATQALRDLAPKAPAPRVEALLCLALALLWPAERPSYAEHTLVDQAVAATRRRSPGAAAFVNAVLRRFVREREA
ncbi:MAG TPA: 16S rRNA (cytosine(967)-C(5))-methyltransferase RsmB, partial [Rubrivivax sp.]|nr:16S rRNA (cytosine(967)-C(5))-methyltransferase RsmB [Rubrivivax sp.]